MTPAWWAPSGLFGQPQASVVHAVLPGLPLEAVLGEAGPAVPLVRLPRLAHLDFSGRHLRGTARARGETLPSVSLGCFLETKT